MSSMKPQQLKPKNPLPKLALPADTSKTSTCSLQISKNWVVPPRPKPGRKPASSASATASKRKAQNREAQKAFRERRAQKYEEIEVEMQKMREEYERRELALKTELRSLTVENSSLREKVDQVDLATTLVHKMPHSRKSSISSISSEVSQSVPLATNAEPKSEEMEIDFTEQYRKKSSPKPVSRRSSAILAQSPLSQTTAPPFANSPPSSPRDHTQDFGSCGFCNEGTPCMCRDSNLSLPPLVMPLSPMSPQLAPVLHPDPSRERHIPDSMLEAADRQQEETKSVTKEDKGPECTGNPGNCRQCQYDPMSSLFCQTVAAQPQSSAPTNPKAAYIPCSQAYRTLAKHQQFIHADLSSLVGHLSTKGMQVEVNSVARVLRELDRRFAVE